MFKVNNKGTRTTPGVGKRQKVKNTIFDNPLIVNQPFLETEYVLGKSDFAHIMHFH